MTFAGNAKGGPPTRSDRCVLEGAERDKAGLQGSARVIARALKVPVLPRAPGAEAIGLAAGIAGAILGLALAGRSLVLGISLSRPLPSMDQWEFVDDLMRYDRGTYGFLDLFSQHNEHRIFTARLHFFADYLFFHLGNLSVILASYALLAVLAGILAAVASRGRGAWTGLLAFSFALPALWSLAGWVNLGWAFQIQWSYVHLLPALSILLFVRAARVTGAPAWGFLALACASDFFAVFSMSSGLCTVVPVVAAAIWIRSPPRLLLVFVLLHAAMVGLFLYGYQTPDHDLVLNPVRLVAYLAPYLGTAFPGSKRMSIVVGALGLLIVLPSLVAATWAAAVRRERLDGFLAVLLGVAVFVLAEGVATAFGRSGLNDPTGLALRYGTPSQVFWTSLALAAWRWLGQAPHRSGARSALAVVSFCAVLATNSLGATQGRWEDQAGRLEAETFGLINGVTDGPSAERLYPRPDLIQDRISFVRAHQLGPFAEEESEYRGPTNSLSGLEASTLPFCRGRTDRFERRGEAQVHLQGWAVAPVRPISAAWIVALSRDGRMLGYARTTERRPDVRLHGASKGVTGYDFWFNAASPRGGESPDLSLIALFPGGTAGPCRLAQPEAR